MARPRNQRERLARKAELEAQARNSEHVAAAEPAPEGPTRESIGKMRKAELQELLEAHGVVNPQGKVDELREMALRVVFFDGGKADD